MELNFDIEAGIIVTAGVQDWILLGIVVLGLIFLFFGTLMAKALEDTLKI